MEVQEEITIQDIIAQMKKNNRKTDTKLILKAYKCAEENHRGQCRKSGEPYIIHPISVAYILAQIGLDDATICAALLHDVVEDTDVTYEQMKKEFGDEISAMVDGVTKLSTIQYTSAKEMQVEEYRKMYKKYN